MKGAQSGDDTVVESFPRCFFFVHEIIPSPSNFKVNEVHASGEESSEFNLASPTTSDYKFEVHDHYSEDPDMIDISE